MKTKKLTRAQKQALGLKKPDQSKYEIRQTLKRISEKKELAQ